MIEVRRPLHPMPDCPALEPWVTMAELADYMRRPVEDPAFARVLEFVPAEHYRAADRALSGLAACWVCMQVDPTLVMTLFVLLRLVTPDLERFQYPAGGRP